MSDAFVIYEGRRPQPEFKAPPTSQEDDILYKLRELERRIQLLESQAGTS
jgi:hypothetical protein